MKEPELDAVTVTRAPQQRRGDTLNESLPQSFRAFGYKVETLLPAGVGERYMSMTSQEARAVLSPQQ
jgi:hypothetical protein